MMILLTMQLTQDGHSTEVEERRFLFSLVWMLMSKSVDYMFNLEGNSFFLVNGIPIVHLNKLLLLFLSKSCPALL